MKLESKKFSCESSSCEASIEKEVDESTDSVYITDVCKSETTAEKVDDNVVVHEHLKIVNESETTTKNNKKNKTEPFVDMIHKFSPGVELSNFAGRFLGVEGRKKVGEIFENPLLCNFFSMRENLRKRFKDKEMLLNKASPEVKGKDIKCRKVESITHKQYEKSKADKISSDFKPKLESVQITGQSYFDNQSEPLEQVECEIEAVPKTNLTVPVEEDKLQAANDESTVRSEDISPYPKNMIVPDIVKSEELIEQNKKYQIVPYDWHNKYGPMNPVKLPSGRKKLTLQDMQDEIIKKDILIVHDGNIYYFDGSTYKLISNSDDLLRFIRSNTSHDAFESTDVKQFNSLIIYLKADNRLIPQNYKKRLKDSKYYVVFKNGVLDLRTFKLNKHSKKYLTFYKLNAKYTEEKPKLFMVYLKTISNGDKEIELRIVETMGCIFTFINECKAFFVAAMEQNSGKSVLGNLTSDLLGKEYVANISTNQIDGRFALGTIAGKLLNVSMDLPKGKLNPKIVSLIKQITGGDDITVEQKYQTPQTIHSNMRFLFGSNYPVTIPSEEDDDSFWERMVIIPFLHSIPREEADHDILDKLLKEKDEIISYCLRAFSNVINNNFIFSYCAAAEEMKAAWRNCVDELDYTVEEFINDRVNVTGNSKDDVYAQELYGEYCKYCKERNYDYISYNGMIKWISNNLSYQCEKKRIHHHAGENPKAGYIGIKLIDLYE